MCLAMGKEGPAIQWREGLGDKLLTLYSEGEVYRIARSCISTDLSRTMPFRSDANECEPDAHSRLRVAA